MLHSFYKKPLCKQPGTRQPKIQETFRQIAHRNRYLFQRTAVPKQCEYGIALECNSC